MSAEFRHIVRIAGRDLVGSKKVEPALSDIKGLGDNLASAMVRVLRIDPRTRMGLLSDKEISEVEASLKDLSKLGIPPWLMNRRKDLGAGSNFHLIGAEKDLAIKSDIDREVSVMSWRGIRHSLGLKVRGQRTRTTGRKGRTVGVKKTALRAVPPGKTEGEKPPKK